VTARLGEGRSITVSGPNLTLDSFIAWLDELAANAKAAKSQDMELHAFLASVHK
jgi:hypothetical protein